MVKAAFAILAECAYWSKLQIHEQHRTRDCKYEFHWPFNHLDHYDQDLVWSQSNEMFKVYEMSKSIFSSTTSSLSEINKRRFHFRAVVFSNKYFKVFCCL